MSKHTITMEMTVTIVLVVLKLTDIVSWSWWWITLPLWWDIVLVGLLVLLVVLAMGFVVFYQLLMKLLVK